MTKRGLPYLQRETVWKANTGESLSERDLKGSRLSHEICGANHIRAVAH